jgi:hypothetical protein
VVAASATVKSGPTRAQGVKKEEELLSAGRNDAKLLQSCDKEGGGDSLIATATVVIYGADGALEGGEVCVLPKAETMRRAYFAVGEDLRLDTVTAAGSLKISRRLPHAAVHANKEEVTLFPLSVLKHLRAAIDVVLVYSGGK